MSKDTQLPEEERPVEETVQTEPTEEENVQEEEEALAPDTGDQSAPPNEESAEKQSAPSRKKSRGLPHPLWRGWWLAAVLLGCLVLMGPPQSPGATWLRQPLRAFAGAVLLGGALASLPGIFRGVTPTKPAWKRCLWAVLCGLAWGVLA